MRSLLSTPWLLRCVSAVSLLSAGCDSSMQSLLDLNSAEPACRAPLHEDQLAQTVLLLVNQERELRGMNPLSLNEELSRFGADYACSMIENDFFDHDNPMTGETFADRHSASPFRCAPAGENLALGQISAVSVVDDWMKSDLHRENILEDGYKDMGLAVRENSVDGRQYWVQLFVGRPPEHGGPGCETEAAAAPEPDPNGVTFFLSDTPALPTASSDTVLVRPATQESADPSAGE